MDLGRSTLFTMIGRRMDWLTERQQVLAQNVSNVDTPGYRARDLRAQSFRALVGEGTRLAAATTAAGHLAPRRASGANAREIPAPFEITNSGNTVSVEQEMTKAAETAVDYQLVTNLYRRHLGMIRIAIGSGGAR